MWGKKKQKNDVPTGLTHDFSSVCWGHNVSITSILDDGLRLEAFCWSMKPIRTNDYLILKNKANTTRYRVTEAKWCRDPDDMYILHLEFAPREG